MLVHGGRKDVEAFDRSLRHSSEGHSSCSGSPSSSSSASLFFCTDASLLHQQRSRPFLWVSTLEVKQGRYENQSKHTPKPPQNTTTKTRSNPPKPKRQTSNVYVSPALSTRGRRRSPGVIEQRRACGRVAKREGLPDNQNHHHEATGATTISTESCKSKTDSRVTERHGQVPGTQ